jgi:hypothetical protein
LVKKVLSINKFESITHQLYLDQGIRVSRDVLLDMESSFSLKVHVQCDSKLHAGIQIADYAAHSIGGMLLEELGILKKMISVDAESG